MKRLLLVAALCAPVAGFAATPTVDPITGGDAAAGAVKAASCAACHGPGGASAIPVNPKLAGQGSRYVHEQLYAFKTGLRPSPIMTPMAMPLTEQDMRDLAAFFGAQKPAPGVASKDAVARAEQLFRAGDAARGLAACAACHGPTGAGNPAAAYPRIGGQHAAYGSQRLRAYRETAAAAVPAAPQVAAAERPRVDSIGNNRGMMAAVAAKLTDEEIEALASYVNGLQ